MRPSRAAFATLTALLVFACHSQRDGAGTQASSSSASAASSGGSAPRDASTCPSNEDGYQPPPWKPPHPKQDVCSSQDIDDYLHDCVDPATAIPIACQQFTANKGACAACILPMDTSKGDGALVTRPGGVTVNVGGCVALALGDDGAAGCGAREWAADACAEDACASCATIDTKCLQAARKGTCAPLEMKTCPELSVAAGCALERGFDGDYAYVAKVFCGGG